MMSAVNRNRLLSRIGVIIAAFLIAFSSLVCVRGFAATDYIATWADYKESGGAAATWNDVANAMDAVLDAADELYQGGDADGAYKAVNAAYYGYYETTGFERNAMGYIAGSRKTEVELQFSACKAVAKKGGSTDDFRAELDTLSGMLHEDANKLDGVDDDGSSSSSSSSSSGSGVSVDGGGGGWVTFMACFGIILREGLEAILVVGAIIAYLVKSGNRDKLKFVYIGCLLAIAASFAVAGLLDLLKSSFEASEVAAKQEVIEGITALIAVLVLFYVSNWMVSKASADTWTKYIDDQVKVSAETGSVFTLGFTAFLAVFREGAEVILFFQPLLTGDKKMVWGGFGVGCVVLAVVFVLIRFFSVRLPIRPFFLGTSILMFVMSISFLGSGIKELLEGDVFTKTPMLEGLIPVNNVTDVLGIYPTAQTLIPQLILILITILIFVMQGWKTQNRKEAGILAIILGGIGAHKFYLGKYGQGLICAALCWTFIPAVIGIAQGVHYLTETDEQFEEELKPKPKAPKKKKEKKPSEKVKAQAK